MFDQSHPSDHKRFIQKTARRTNHPARQQMPSPSADETILQLLEVVFMRVPGDARAVDCGDESAARLINRRAKGATVPNCAAHNDLASHQTPSTNQMRPPLRLCDQIERDCSLSLQPLSLFHSIIMRLASRDARSALRSKKRSLEIASSRCSPGTLKSFLFGSAFRTNGSKRLEASSELARSEILVLSQ